MNFLLVIIGVVFMILIVLAIHELGHLITGLVQGFKFQLFIVGPLGIKATSDDKIKVYFNKELAYYGGVSATIPADDSPENPKKLRRMILAGPITSLVFAVLLALLSLWISLPTKIFILGVSTMSFMIFLATSIPAKSGMFYSDRKRYQRLVRSGKDQAIELAMLRLLGRFSMDQSYKNIDLADIKILTTDESKIIQFYGWYNLVCYDIEMNTEVSDFNQKEYDNCAKHIDKNVVAAFNKELESYRKHCLNRFT